MSESSSKRTDPRSRSGAANTEGAGVAAVVLGMHRSGTSAAARLLSLLGADLPRNLLPANPTNEAGHWEPQHVADLNDELLTSAGSAWDDVGAFPSTWHGSTSEAGFRARAVEILEAEYGNSPLFVLKDPRICRLTPFWLGVLEDFGVQASFVVMVRNPLEVANSLRVRDGFPIAKGLLMWLRHTLDAERDTRGHPRVFVSYEALLRDWEDQAKVISEALELSWPKLNSRARAEINRFLSPTLRHAEFSADELVAHRSVVDWVKTTYLVLEAACEAQTTPDSEALDEIRAVLDQAEIAYGPVLADVDLEAQDRAQSLEEIAEYEQANSALAEQLASQIREHEALRAELETVRAGHAEYAESHERLTKALAARTEQLSAQTEELEQLETYREAHGSELERLRDELERLRDELERSSADAASEASRHRTLLEELASERDALASENETMTRSLEESEDRLRARGAEVDALRAELSKRLDEAKEVVGARDRELAELTTSLHSRELEYSDLIVQMRREVERFAQTERELEVRTVDMQAEMRAQMQFIREQDARLHALDVQLAESRRQLESPSLTRRVAARFRRGFSRGRK